MPPQCQYSEVTKSNDIAKSPWYADQNLTQPLNEEQILKGESIIIWTDHLSYHTEHCLFLYRKLMYAMAKRMKWLDKKTLSSEHANHCVKELIGGPGGKRDHITRVWVQLGMYTCEEMMW